jgi:hypothetical protein
MSTISIAHLRHRDDDPLDPGALRRPLSLRLKVSLQRDALTRDLALGASPTASAELTLRAAQLIGLRHRRQLARSLRRLPKEARAPHLIRSTIIHRYGVVQAEAAINALIARLDDNQPVAVQGMAMLEQLLTDGASSPLYNAGELSTLRRQVEVVTEAMDPELAEAVPAF